MGVPNLAGSLVLFSVLAFVGFLIWNRTRVNLDRRKLQFDAEVRMLEKIGPGQALTDFVKTNQGKLFFGQSTGQQSAPSWSKDTYTQILVLTTLGLIAVCAGLSFVLAVSIVMALADNPITPGARFVAFLPVFLLTGSGVGALLAAWVMNRLSKKWGMLHDHCADQWAFQLADAHDPALAHER